MPIPSGGGSAAPGTPYATLTQLKARIGVAGSGEDTPLAAALDVATSGINGCCHRQFNKDSVASPRTFTPEGTRLAVVDDFYDTTGLQVATDDDADGTYETVWDPGDYLLEPADGIVTGEAGWPYQTIRPRRASGRYFRGWDYNSLQVTALWGWAAVPATITEVCLILAEEVYKLKDAPFGVAGFGDYGPMRVKENPLAVAKLRRYVKDAVLVA